MDNKQQIADAVQKFLNEFYGQASSKVEHT